MTNAVALAQMGTVQNSFKNRIINGAMMIDQRNAGASITVNTNGAKFSCDRWYFQGENTDGVFTVQQSSTAPAGFTKSMLLTVTTADSSIGASQTYFFKQAIEGYNIADLGWGAAGASSITISFWVRSSVTGTFGASVVNGAGTRSYPFSYTINSANAFEYKTVTIAGDASGTWTTDNSAGLALWFSVGAGSTYKGTANTWASTLYFDTTGSTNLIATNGATFQITGVQLEKGSTATSFDYRPYGTELALCQRYYEKSYNVEVAPATNTGQGLVDITASTNGGGSVSTMVYYKIPKRTTPTVTFITNDGVSTGIWNYARSGASGTVTVTAYGGANSMYVYTSSISLAWGVSEVYGHWTSSAEL